MPSTSADALISLELLAGPSRQCQILIFLFLLTRWVGRPRSLTAITWRIRLLLTECVSMVWLTLVAFPSVARSRTIRLRLLLACAITFPSFIKVILEGLSWKEIPFFRSWPRNIRLELHSVAIAIFCKSIVPFLRSINTVLTCSVYITWPATVTKLMHIGRRSLNKDLSLHRCREAQELRYHIPHVFSTSGNEDSATIIAFATGPGVNGSEESESSSITTWCALFEYLAGSALLLFWGVRENNLFDVRESWDSLISLRSGWLQFLL